MNNWDGFYALNPEDILLVLHKGSVRLFDESMLSQLGSSFKNFYPVSISGSTKYVQGNLPGLRNDILQHFLRAEFPFTLPVVLKSLSNA